VLQRRDRGTRLADVARLAVRPARENLLTRDTQAVTGVGFELVYLPDFMDRLADGAFEKAFTDEESTEGAEASDPNTYFGSRLAAKEAARKAVAEIASALRIPADGLCCLANYEVAHRPMSVVPEVKLSGRPKFVVDQLRARGCDVTLSVSITHERDYAGAFVVISALPIRDPSTLACARGA
jgi:phosphopantetheine--protein transferase-like protein